MIIKNRLNSSTKKPSHQPFFLGFSLLLTLLVFFIFSGNVHESQRKRILGLRADSHSHSHSPHALNKIVQARNLILRNVSPEQALKGTVLASPSRREPDYYYHWTRDAALVMNSLLKVWNFQEQEDVASLQGGAPSIHVLIEDYADLSKHHQSVASLGEPKFMVNDGSPFTGPWGRPQNDGPALRILTLSSYLEEYGLDKASCTEGNYCWYESAMPPTKSLLKKDLEYVAHHWTNRCFDLWEEVEAHHYYNRIVSLASMQVGAALARQFKDYGASLFYGRVADLIESDMESFWNEERKFIRASFNAEDNHGKGSNLDVAVILACLHTKDYLNPSSLPDFQCSSDRVLVTALKLAMSFEAEYPINWEHSTVPLIGRYPEDVYDGTGISIGNPWILSTHAFAEYFYTLSNIFFEQKEVLLTKSSLAFYRHFIPGVVTASEGEVIVDGDDLWYLCGNLTRVGDLFLERVEQFTKDGRMTEQISRETGELLGAGDLSWSYGSYLTAVLSRPA